MAAELAPYILVRGAVVYRLARPQRVREDYRYIRMSVPPDATPGKASKFKPVLKPERLPEHAVIPQDEAERIMHASLAEFEQRLAAMKERSDV